ncbi:MAG TPA: hypothetical protein VFP61_08195 [Acidimicrobiales bacterium]|nr:hypothetical protein [Acidimicrobiales bacterium]
MPKAHWDDLSPSTRRFIIAGAAVEGLVKAVTLVDLAQRPAGGVHGSKARWAAAIVLVNSGGIVPALYLIRGRRRAGAGRSAGG